MKCNLNSIILNNIYFSSIESTVFCASSHTNKNANFSDGAIIEYGTIELETLI